MKKIKVGILSTITVASALAIGASNFDLDAIKNSSLNEYKSKEVTKVAYESDKMTYEGYQDTGDFYAKFITNSKFTIEQNGRYAEQQGHYIINKQNNQVVFCLDPFETAGKVDSEKLKGSRFNDFSKAKQWKIVSHILAGIDLYDKTGDEIYLAGTQLLVWQDVDSVISNSTSNLKNAMNKINLASENYKYSDFNADEAGIFITSGQELLFVDIKNFII